MLKVLPATNTTAIVFVAADLSEHTVQLLILRLRLAHAPVLVKEFSVYPPSALEVVLPSNTRVGSLRARTSTAEQRG